MHSAAVPGKGIFKASGRAGAACTKQREQDDASMWWERCAKQKAISERCDSRGIEQYFAGAWDKWGQWNDLVGLKQWTLLFPEYSNDKNSSQAVSSYELDPDVQ